MAGPAAAQTNAAQAAAAEALYDEGTKLLEAGNAAAACPKLAESFRLDPALGALLSLAVCRERAGQLASAWVTYLDVVARAKASGDAERAGVAKERADALAPRLPRLTIELGSAVTSLPGVKVTRDGQSVDPAVASTAIPVDPGEHVVTVTATGRGTVEKRVLAAEGATIRVSVDEVPAAEAPAAPTTPPPSEGGPSEEGTGGLSSLQVTGLITGGVGVVALGVGLAFGAVAMGAQGELDDRGYNPDSGVCSTDPGACPGFYDDASGAATLSTVFVIAGTTLAAAGVVLVLVGGDEAPTEGARLDLVPSLGGLTMRGAL